METGLLQLVAALWWGTGKADLGNPRLTEKAGTAGRTGAVGIGTAAGQIVEQTEMVGMVDQTVEKIELFEESRLG